MTYVIGWKSISRVYILADSIISSHRESASTIYSSVGVKLEGSERHPGRIDRFRKVFNISNKIIIGFSGEVDSAIEFITHFRRSIERTNNFSPALIKQQISESLSEAIEKRKQNTFSLIIGFISNGCPILYKFQNSEIIDDENIVQIGSLSMSNQSKNTSDLYNLLVDKCPEEHQLAIFGSVILSNVSRDSASMSKYGVGGLFLGIQVSKEGVSWQSDTLLVIYDQENISKNRSLGMKSFIENSIIVYWGFYKDIMALISTTQGSFLIMDEYTLSTFDHEQEYEVFKNLKTKVAYAIFISTKPALITALLVNPTVKKSKYLDCEVDHAQQTFSFKVEDALMELLTRHLEDDIQDATTPSKLDVIFDTES
jgi:hypothetical protein